LKSFTGGSALIQVEIAALPAMALSFGGKKLAPSV
jgi:hypothetical protein